MPRRAQPPTTQPTENLVENDRSDVVYDGETGEVIEPSVTFDQTGEHSLVPSDSVAVAPSESRAITEQELLLQLGSYQVPLTMEERRLYLVAQSGVYKSVRTLGQAVALSGVAKVLGISEHAAFSGVYLMPNGMSVSAHLIGALVRRSGVYDYKVVEMTRERAEIAWYKHGEEIGRSSFTIEQARANGWVTSKRVVWITHPHEQCRNRALTEGCRTFCGEVFAGAGVYDPEELADAEFSKTEAR